MSVPALARRFGRRAVELAVTFAGITAVTFALLHLTPGEPAAVVSDGALSPVGIAAWRALRSPEGSLLAHYADWLARVVRLDLGRSLIDERPVTLLIAEALPRTALLAGAALAAAYAAAVPLGVLAAARRGRLAGHLASGTLFVLYSLPPFGVATGLLVGLAAGEPWALFPLRGLVSLEAHEAGPLARLADLAWHLVLPVTCLSLPFIARTARLLRATLLDVATQEFVRQARARGLPERRLWWRHVLPNALVPLAAQLSLDLPLVVGGSVVVERVFSIRGMGMLAFEAVLRRDYPLVLGVTVLVSLVTMTAMAAGELLHLVVDPRARRGLA